MYLAGVSDKTAEGYFKNVSNESFGVKVRFGQFIVPLKLKSTF